jgi:tetratricopeptide (TPR) repeat protein
LRNTGRWDEAEALVAANIDAAATLEERDLAVRAGLTRAWMESWDPRTHPDETRRAAEEAIGALTEGGDPSGLAEAWRLLGYARAQVGRVEAGGAAMEEVVRYSELAGDRGMLRLGHAGVISAALYGPTPVREAIRRFDELIRANPGDGLLEALVMRYLGPLLAMAGRFDEARDLVERSNRVLDQSGHIGSWATRAVAAEARELIGDLPGAEHELETTWRAIDAYRNGAVDIRTLQTAAQLAMVYCDDGRWDDAERCLELGRDFAAPDCFTRGSVNALAVRARLAGHRGELKDAVALARRAVERAALCDIVNLKAAVWLALAEVQRRAGADAEADTAVAEALALYEQKGNVASATRLRTPTAAAT